MITMDGVAKSARNSSEEKRLREWSSMFNLL
jgi:hypothetical protein